MNKQSKRQIESPNLNLSLSLSLSLPAIAMGQAFRKLFDTFFGNPEIRVYLSAMN